MYQKRVVKKVAKKKTASGPGRGPGAAGKAPAAEKIFFGAKPKPKQGTPAGYRPPSTESPGLGIGALFLFLFAIALLGGVAVCFMPPDLSAISGYPQPEKPAKSENLLRRLDDATTDAYVDKKESTVVFSEEEINAYLNQRLKQSQTGPLASLATNEGIFCDLQPDTANLYVVRTFFGKPMIIYTTWAFEGDPDDQKFTCQLSGIGSIKVAGSGLQPVMAPFLRLREICVREISALMNTAVDRLRIEDGRLVVHVQP